MCEGIRISEAGIVPESTGLRLDIDLNVGYGVAAIETPAREAKAFLRARVIGNAVDLLRLILAYCLGQGGLRSTAAWAGAIGLVDISNVALLQRVRRCGDWLGAPVGDALAAGAPAASRGRRVRLVDAAAVPQAGLAARQKERVAAHSQRF
jgi:hypothetical protein